MLWRLLGATPVAGLAGYVSWDHISGLLTSIGEAHTVCMLAPLAVDGLMFIGVGGLMIPPDFRLQTAREQAAGRLGLSTPDLGRRDERRDYLTGRSAVPGRQAEEVARSGGNGGRIR
jgi:hypothetical protein